MHVQFDFAQRGFCPYVSSNSWRAFFKSYIAYGMAYTKRQDRQLQVVGNFHCGCCQRLFSSYFRVIVHIESVCSAVLWFVLSR